MLKRTPNSSKLTLDLNNLRSIATPIVKSNTALTNLLMSPKKRDPKSNENIVLTMVAADSKSGALKN
ncbi:hypothetical protein OAA67_04905, partial [Winogradskyella sp.]|nr:hypothetical protein [Winogradskyella sp.]